MNKATLPDWIQAIALVIAAAAAFYQFVIEGERDKAVNNRFMMELVQAGGTPAMVHATGKMYENFNSVRGGTIDEGDAISLLNSIRPVVDHYISWQSCIEIGLCSSKKVHNLICSGVLDLEIIYGYVTRTLEKHIINSVYRKLAVNCNKWSLN